MVKINRVVFFHQIFSRYSLTITQWLFTSREFDSLNPELGSELTTIRHEPDSPHLCLTPVRGQYLKAHKTPLSYTYLDILDHRDSFLLVIRGSSFRAPVLTTVISSFGHPQPGPIRRLKPKRLKFPLINFATSMRDMWTDSAAELSISATSQGPRTSRHG